MPERGDIGGAVYSYLVIALLISSLVIMKWSWWVGMTHGYEGHSWDTYETLMRHSYKWGIHESTGISRTVHSLI